MGNHLPTNRVDYYVVSGNQGNCVWLGLQSVASSRTILNGWIWFPPNRVPRRGLGLMRVSIMAKNIKVSGKVSKTVSGKVQADQTAVILQALQGLDSAQLARLLASIKIGDLGEKTAPPTPVSPKKPKGDGGAIVVRPVAESVASKPAIALPTPVNNPLSTGAIENVPVICTGISPVFWNRFRKPQRIVNLVHSNGTPFVVYMDDRATSGIETGAEYLLSGILEGTDETPTVCRQSKPYNGVSANVVKKAVIEKA